MDQADNKAVRGEGRPGRRKKVSIGMTYDPNHYGMGQDTLRAYRLTPLGNVNRGRLVEWLFRLQI